MSERSPGYHDAPPTADFSRLNSLKDVADLLQELSRQSIEVRSNVETIPVDVLAEAIMKAFNAFVGEMRIRKISKNMEGLEGVVDGLLASNGVTRKGGLREKIGRIMLGIRPEHLEEDVKTLIDEGGLRQIDTLITPPGERRVRPPYHNLKM